MTKSFFLRSSPVLALVFANVVLPAFVHCALSSLTAADERLIGDELLAAQTYQRSFIDGEHHFDAQTLVDALCSHAVAGFVPMHQNAPPFNASTVRCVVYRDDRLRSVPLPGGRVLMSSTLWTSARGGAAEVVAHIAHALAHTALRHS